MSHGSFGFFVTKEQGQILQKKLQTIMSSTPSQQQHTSSSNINPPSSSGTFVRIEAVRLLIHQPSKKTIYRKLLAPEPLTSLQFVDEHFVKKIRLIEGCRIQFEFDFRVVANDQQQQQQQQQTSDINLLFHEVLQDGRGVVCGFYVENMGKYEASPKDQSYRYTTTLSNISRSLNHQSFRLEIFDLDQTAWFIGEWQVRLQSAGMDANDWLRRGNSNVFDVGEPANVDNVDDFDELNEEDFDVERLRRAGSSSLVNLRIPSNFPSRTSSPLSQSSTTTSTTAVTQNEQRSPTNSLAASFEDLEMTDFSELTSEQDSSLALPPFNGSNTLQDRLKLFDNESLLALNENRRNSNVPSRSGTPKQSDENTANFSTVDILHQVGTNLFSSKLGQIVSSSIKSDPSEMNLKTVYSTSTIHLLGTKYQLQGLQSNVLFMEANEEENFEEPACEIMRLTRFNNFSFLLQRLDVPNSSRRMVTREVLLLKRSGPLISSRLKNWLEANGILGSVNNQSSSESSYNHMIIEEFTPATLKISSSSKKTVIDLKVYSLKPNETSPENTPELFLVDLQASQHLQSPQNQTNNFHLIAEINAIFVELTASIVQIEVEEARRAPEIVLMETWNSHTEPEVLVQSESIPIVKYSVIPEANNFMTFVYFWSDHLQGWLLQSLTITGIVLSIHPLLDARMAIQLNLSGSHLKASQDEDARIGNFTLITSRGQVFNFRTVQAADLKEIIGRIRFAMLSRASGNGSRTRRQGSLLQADKIYRGSTSTTSTQQLSEQEVERIRTENISTMDSFVEDFRTRFWFTYRRNFPRIEPSLFTTDLGWGCMLRTGQCLMAEALARFYFGRNWRLWQLESDSEEERTRVMRQFHSKILAQFIDQSRGEYSVHRMAGEGVKIGTPIGQWFGPSVIGKVLK